MSKAKLALGSWLLVALIASIALLFPRPEAAADLTWSQVNLPAEGPDGKWMLAAKSDIRCLTQASDGTLYCWANPSSTPFRLFKSTDAGASWQYTGRFEDNIVDMAIVPDSPQSVYFATTSKIYKLNLAADRSDIVAVGPGGAGANGIEITSLDAASAHGVEIIVAGTRDTDSLQFGGVYTRESGPSAEWQDTGIGNYDAYTVAFSPDYAVDGQILAVASDEQDTVISTNIKAGGWGTSIGDGRIMGRVPGSAAMAFPADYKADLVSEKYHLWVALNNDAGEGDVFRLDGKAAPEASPVTDLKVGLPDISHPGITSLAASGNFSNGTLMAGAAASAQVWTRNSSDGNWVTAQQPPSGESETRVLMAPDYGSSGSAYACTSGRESAFSMSRDKGATWSQTGLIDTQILQIADLAVSPDADLFLLTANIQESLWHSPDKGLSWERLYCTTGESAEHVRRVLLSPQYPQNHKVFLAGTAGENAVIWHSEDSGHLFNRVDSIDPETREPVVIDTWAIAAGDVIFAGSLGGKDARIYQTAPGGLSYIDNASAGTHKLQSLAISPAFSQDHSLLAGNGNGGIYFSHDGGLIFEPLPFNSGTPPLNGKVTVSFDANFSQNRTVYAANNGNSAGIYRFVINSSTAWEPIDYSLPVGGKIDQIVTPESGLLYAVNSQPVDATTGKGGLERSLDPASSTPVFSTVTSGLTNGTVLHKLWAEGSTLWSIDTTFYRLWTYSDNLLSPVSLITPVNGASGLPKSNIILSWSALNGATSYHWQVDTDNQFASIPDRLEDETDSLLATLPTLDPDITYYWRVRATQPVTSPWSEIRSFNTNIVPEMEIPQLSEPRSTSRSSLDPIFKWSACAGADKYDLQVSGADTFTSMVIDKTGDNACNTNGWKSEILLNYNTSYYWRVRAVSGENRSGWSDTGIFTTQTEPTSSQSGGSGSGGTTSSTPKASPSPTAKSTPSPTIMIMPSATPSPDPPIPASTAVVANISSPVIVSPMAVTSPAVKPSPTASATPSPKPSLVGSAGVTSAQSASGSAPSDTTVRWLFFLIGGLFVLLIVLAVVVVYMLKKFKRY